MHLYNGWVYFSLTEVFVDWGTQFIRKNCSCTAICQAVEGNRGWLWKSSLSSTTIRVPHHLHAPSCRQNPPAPYSYSPWLTAWQEVGRTREELATVLLARQSMISILPSSPSICLTHFITDHTWGLWGLFVDEKFQTKLWRCIFEFWK